MNESNVLGQRKYRGNFDPGLAERLNAEAVEEETQNAMTGRSIPGEKSPEPMSNGSSPDKKVIKYEIEIDDVVSIIPTSQDYFIAYWNRRKDDFAMMSSGDFYGVARQLRQDFLSGSKRERKKAYKSFEQLRISSGRGIILNTRIQYDINGLYGKLIHHSQSRHAELIKKDIVMIPELDSSIECVTNHPEMLSYLQSYFDTKDDAKQIIENLEFFGECNKNQIRLKTLPYVVRKVDRRDRTALIGFGTGSRFYIHADFASNDTPGHSYRVRIIREGDKQ